MGIDLDILESTMASGLPNLRVWEPGSPMVVTGRGGNTEREVFSSECKRDGVPIIRRRTGGGTVVLAPGMAVFSLAKSVGRELEIQLYNRQINGLIIDFLRIVGNIDAIVRGISDVCVGDRKIMGSGMYRSRKILFFQGVILSDPDLSLLDKYLPHPPKEPDYRQGRKHGDFLTTMKREGIALDTHQVLKKLETFLWENIDYIY